jgi:hypothetical protein
MNSHDEHVSRTVHNTISGSGNIHSGGEVNYHGSMVNVSGSGNNTTVGTTVGSGTLSQLMGPVGQALASARHILEATPTSDEVDDALAAIDETQRALDDARTSGLNDPRMLRQRIKGLIGVLTPAAQIAAGLDTIITSFSGILKHL